MRRFEIHPLWWLLLLLALAPIFAADYLPTGDTPCHFYNSRLIYELWQGNDYLNNFYYLNGEVIPNWLTNLVHIPLLLLFGPAAAEKLFFVIYVLVFVFGFRYLVRQFDKDAALWITGLVLPFLWAKPIWMGFTNNMLCFGIAFWVVGYYLEHRRQMQTKHYFIFFLGTLLLYFAHPVGLIFTCLGIGSLGIGTVFSEDFRLKSFLRTHLSLLLCCLPTFLMLYQFASKRTYNNRANPDTFVQKLSDLVHLRSLVGLSSRERDIVFTFSMFVLLLAIAAIWKRKAQIKKELAIGVLCWITCAFLLVFKGPTSFSGGTNVAVRIGFLPHLLMLVFAALCLDFSHKWLRYLIGLGLVVFSVSILQVRVPIIREASELVEEVVACQSHIRPTATLLTLNYDYGGKTQNGQAISNKVWLFAHVGCYLGQFKPLVIGDNYEANMKYFPVIAHWRANMYEQTMKEGQNFDQFPARADILGYKARTGHELDYVILINYPDMWADHAFTKEIEQQLAQGYRRVFASARGRAILFERNGSNE